MIYGKEPGWRTEGVNVDAQGRVKLELFKPWSPLLEVDGNRAVLPEFPEPPVVPGFRKQAGRWKRSKDGGFGMLWAYDGVQPPASGSGSEGREFGEEWSFSGSGYQRDLRTAENWDELRDKYQWDEEKKEFPDETDESAQVRGTSMVLGTRKKLNPMRGQKSLDDYSGTLTRSYFASAIPAAALARANRIVKKPYSRMPAMPDDRDWKYTLPDWEEVGDYFRMSEHMELSGPGGWNKDTYKGVKS